MILGALSGAPDPTCSDQPQGLEVHTILPKFQTNYVKQYFSMSQLHKKISTQYMYHYEYHGWLRNLVEGTNAKTLEYEKKWNIQVEIRTFNSVFSSLCKFKIISTVTKIFQSILYHFRVQYKSEFARKKKNIKFSYQTKSAAKIIIRIYMLLKLVNY